MRSPLVSGWIFGAAPAPGRDRSTRLSAPIVALVATTAAAALSCDKPPPPAPPPHEACLVVTSESAPLIRKPTEDASAQDVVHAGELLKLVRDVRPMRWSGKIEGVKAERDGQLLEVKYVEDGAHRFAFKPDLGAEISVPVTTWLCDAIAAQGAFEMARCPAELRRAKTTDGALLVYLPCTSGLCPVGLVRDGKVQVLGVENLIAARFFLGKKRSMLLASVRWSRDEGRQSGGAFAPLLLDGPAPVRRDDIPADRVDARDPAKVMDRLVQVKIGPTEITLTGEETVKSAADGATLSTKPIDEKHPLPALD